MCRRFCLHYAASFLNKSYLFLALNTPLNWLQPKDPTVASSFWPIPFALVAPGCIFSACEEFALQNLRDFNFIPSSLI